MPAISLCQAKVQTNALGVSNVQVTIWFRWETRVDCPSDELRLRGQVLFDFDFNEVFVGMTTSWFTSVVHYFDFPWFNAACGFARVQIDTVNSIVNSEKCQSEMPK